MHRCKKFVLTAKCRYLNVKSVSRKSPGQVVTLNDWYPVTREFESSTWLTSIEWVFFIYNSFYTHIGPIFAMNIKIILYVNVENTLVTNIQPIFETNIGPICILDVSFRRNRQLNCWYWLNMGSNIAPTLAYNVGPIFKINIGTILN